MLGYFWALSVLALFCSAVFWALACGAVALSGRVSKPILHLVLGFAFQFVWFPVVSIMALVSILKRPAKSPLGATT